MRAVGLTEFGGPEVLRVIELPDPVPGMDAAGVVDAIGPGTDTPLRPGTR